MKNNTPLPFFLCFILFCIHTPPIFAKANSDSTAIKIKTAFKGKLTFTGFAEAYYGYDFGKPQNGTS